MHFGQLTLSSGSCVAQIIYPSATAPQTTGKPESQLSVSGLAHQWDRQNDADSPTHSFINLGYFLSAHEALTFLSLYTSYKQSVWLHVCLSLFMLTREWEYVLVVKKLQDFDELHMSKNACSYDLLKANYDTSLISRSYLQPLLLRTCARPNTCH